MIRQNKPEKKNDLVEKNKTGVIIPDMAKKRTEWSRIEQKTRGYLLKSKRAGIAADPLLTNPLNSDTKLQIGAT